MAITVVLADHHEIAREGTKSLLRGSDIEVVGETDNGRDAVRLVQTLKPRVVLLETQMPEEDGLTALGRIRVKLPDQPVLMFSAHESPAYIARAVALGANGYVVKSTSAEKLVETIHAAARGENSWTPQLLRQVSTALRSPRQKADTEGLLTQRETEVLRLVTGGNTNKQIAEQLKISAETVKEHVQNILRKLGVADRTQAAVWAVRQGMA